MVRRCLPVVLALLVMVAAEAVGVRIYASRGMMSRKGSLLDADVMDNADDIDNAGGSLDLASIEVPVRDDAESPTIGAGRVEVRSGRPDFRVLIRKAGTERLLVAACGPDKLVREARVAVHELRKTGAVDVEIVGTEASW